MPVTISMNVRNAGYYLYLQAAYIREHCCWPRSDAYFWWLMYRRVVAGDYVIELAHRP